MGFFSSIKKSSDLKRIGKVLGQPSNFQSGDFSSSSNKDKALEELLDICENDKQLSQIISKYNSNREELKTIYGKLKISGAGQYALGHFCCASALGFASTLEFILETDLSTTAQAIVLVEYFKRGRIGKP